MNDYKLIYKARAKKTEPSVILPLLAGVLTIVAIIAFVAVSESRSYAKVPSATLDNSKNNLTGGQFYQYDSSDQLTGARGIK